MAKKASRAPKERINIVYRPAAKPAEAVELPLKFLVLADVRGRPDPTEFDSRETVKIDQDSFDSVLAGYDVGVNIRVPDRLSDDPDKQLPVTLNFKSMSDFTPEGIAHQVPELQKLLDLRAALSSLKSPLSNKKAFRGRLAELLNDPEMSKQLLQELDMDTER